MDQNKSFLPQVTSVRHSVTATRNLTKAHPSPLCPLHIGKEPNSGDHSQDSRLAAFWRPSLPFSPFLALDLNSYFFRGRLLFADYTFCMVSWIGFTSYLKPSQLSVHGGLWNLRNAYCCPSSRNTVRTIRLNTRGKEVRKSSQKDGTQLCPPERAQVPKDGFPDTLAWPISLRLWRDMAGNSAMWIWNLLWVYPMHSSGKDEVCWLNAVWVSPVRSACWAILPVPISRSVAWVWLAYRWPGVGDACRGLMSERQCLQLNVGQGKCSPVHTVTQGSWAAIWNQKEENGDSIGLVPSG